MNKKIILVILNIIILTFFLSGCSQLTKAPEKTLDVKDNAVASTDNVINPDLMAKLSFNVTNYKANYRKEHEAHYWKGNSGGTDIIELSNVSIEVKNGQINDYTIRYFKEGWPVETEDYIEEYDNAKNTICRKQHTGQSKCDSPMGVPSGDGGLVHPSDPKRPELKKPLMGCETKCDVGDCSSFYQPCYINGASVFLFNDAIKEVNTSVMADIWQEKPISLGLWYAKYYPETKKGICLYDALIGDRSYFVLCSNQGIILTPLVDNINDLKDIVCSQQTWNDCTCTFDDTDIINCRKETPLSFDTELKEEINNYLIEEADIMSIQEEDNEKGHCYYFSYNELDHRFCFDDSNLITFAQWGKNITDAGTSININRVEMTK